MKTPPSGAGGGGTHEAVVAEDLLSHRERLASLERTGLMGSPPEEAFDRLTRLAARMLRAPVSLVTFLDDKRQFFKSTAGVPPKEIRTTREAPVSHSFCQYVVRSGHPLAVNDAREHPLLRTSPAIDEQNAIAYCGVPISDRQGYVLGTLCVLDDEPREWGDADVTALTELAGAAVAEIHLRVLAGDLGATNEALRDLIATTSHDIRSALSVIVGFAALLRRDNDISPEEGKEFADLIHKSARHANRLIAELLQVSKLQAGVVESQPAVVHLASAVELARRQSERPASEVVSEVPDDLQVIADHDHLHRILTNLIANASKYGRPPVSVIAGDVGGRALIHVADEGPGVPPELVPHLFEKFRRGENARSLNPDGAGLGLTIVAGLAKINGGSVWYEPNSPKGARFTVELPAPKASAIDLTD